MTSHQLVLCHRIFTTPLFHIAVAPRIWNLTSIILNWHLIDFILERIIHFHLELLLLLVLLNSLRNLIGLFFSLILLHINIFALSLGLRDFWEIIFLILFLPSFQKWLRRLRHHFFIDFKVLLIFLVLLRSSSFPNRVLLEVRRNHIHYFWSVGISFTLRILVTLKLLLLLLALRLVRFSFQIFVNFKEIFKRFRVSNNINLGQISYILLKSFSSFFNNCRSLRIKYRIYIRLSINNGSRRFREFQSMEAIFQNRV